MEIMVDIETLGTANNAVITSIGAVKFDLRTPETVEQILARGYFQMHLDASHQQRKGRQLSVDTALWWMQQSETARNDLINGQKTTRPMIEVLNIFSTYCGGAANIWGNGNTFDNVLLRDLYLDYEMKFPVSFRNDMDFRTLKYLVKLKHPYWEIPYPKYGEFQGTAHVGYIDAACQAFSAQQIYRKLFNPEGK